MTRNAIVTGGTSGIGAAICMALKEAGHKVAATYHGNDVKAQDFSKKYGIKVFKFDVGDFLACSQGVKEIEAAHGPTDILVNNAGITRDSFLHKMTLPQWQEVMNTNLNSLFNMTRQVIEGMRTRGFGRIVTISSINGQAGQIGQTNYSAAKAAAIGFTKALALESAQKGITVNTIAPGYIDTDMVRVIAPDILANIVAKAPMRRLGKPEEIAAAVRFLVSEDAAYMTGATLTINGGMYMTG